MTQDSDQIGAGAAFAVRRKSTAARLGLMGVVALLLWKAAGWDLALVWFCLYALTQAALLAADARSGAWGRGPFYALCFLSYCVAGAPSWVLWSSGGERGVAAATMFLCGMLAHISVSSLGAGRLFWLSATPLIGYLILVPPLAVPREKLGEGLTVAACGLILVTYLVVLWRGQQQVLLNVETSRRRAEDASRAKTEFLATMSHEIRTPMNAVLGAADLLGRTELTVEQAEHVAMLRQGGGLLMQILNDVLDLSKIEAGKLTIETANIDTYAFTRRCADFWTPAAQDAGLELIVEVASDVPRHVMLDATRTGQIVFNLLSNAVKFTAAGSVTLSMSSEAVGDGAAMLVLSVADTGMGMSPEMLQRLFTAFEQADGSITRRFGGTGLGLSIAQRLAEMMGGAITARSEPDRGSVFELRLPVALGQAPEVVIDEDAEDFAPPPPSAIRILVAEDNRANQRIIDLFLQPIGAQVMIVGDGRQAVEALATQRFDVVLMDMQMPLMGGLEATRLVRGGGGPNADVPILALTANVMDAHRDACREAGMSGHIAKPIDARLLLASVLTAARAVRAAEAEAA